MSFYKSLKRNMKGLTMRIMSMLPMMSTCEELEKFVVDYLDGTLPEKQRMQFDLHLGLCVTCEKYLQNYRKSIDLSKAAFAELEPSDCKTMPDSLVKAIVAARKETP